MNNIKASICEQRKVNSRFPLSLKGVVSNTPTNKKPDVSLHGSEMLKGSGGAGISSEEPPKDEGQVCSWLCFHDQGLLQGDVFVQR